MTAPHANDPAAAPSAISAFLRGVERRASIFATLQVGDADLGDRALDAAMRAFRGAATQTAVQAWPQRFWTLLLAAPHLRAAPASPHWPVAFEFFSSLGRGPRAALLLRLVAGLSETDAADVLGVARSTYRLALQRALPRDAQDQPDSDAWHALGEASRLAVRELPVERLAHLARIREAALQGRRLEQAPVPPPVRPTTDADASRRAWWKPAMLASAVVVVLAFASTFLIPEKMQRQDDVDMPGIETEALPQTTPAATYDAAAALLTHQDFDLLAADANVSNTPEVRDPAFYAWLAAGAQSALPTSSPEDTAAASASTPRDENTPPETDDAPR